MTSFRVDDISVSTVLEAEAPVFGIRELIPDLDDEILAEERSKAAAALKAWTEKTNAIKQAKMSLFKAAD